MKTIRFFFLVRRKNKSSKSIFVGENGKNRCKTEKCTENVGRSACGRYFMRIAKQVVIVHHQPDTISRRHNEKFQRYDEYAPRVSRCTASFSIFSIQWHIENNNNNEEKKKREKRCRRPRGMGRKFPFVFGFLFSFSFLPLLRLRSLLCFASDPPIRSILFCIVVLRCVHDIQFISPLGVWLQIRCIREYVFSL